MYPSGALISVTVYFPIGNPFIVIFPSLFVFCFATCFPLSSTTLNSAPSTLAPFWSTFTISIFPSLFSHVNCLLASIFFCSKSKNTKFCVELPAPYSTATFSFATAVTFNVTFFGAAALLTSTYTSSPALYSFLI